MEEQDRSGYRQVISSAEGQGTAESSGYYSSGSSAGAEYGRGPADPYAGYYTEPAPAPQEEKKTGFWKGFFTGIGVQVTQDQTTKEVTVITVFRNSSAAGADIRKDDIIVGVDGTDVRQFALDDVVALIRGEEGTYVDVTVHRPSEDRDITVHVQRARVEIDTVEYRMLDKTTGYISLSEFDDVSLGQMQEAIRELSKQGMKQLVFDLRDNPGGLLSSVINISDLFLGRNELVMYMEDKQGQEYKYYSQNAAYFTGKMAVLVNGNSASASEVFSGAMKDHGRAILVGEQTFGKGIVQSFFHLSDDSYVKLTTDHYCTPNGHDIHGTGITPDILAPDDPETLEDEGLAAALLALGAN